jgi:hypothetical protein
MIKLALIIMVATLLGACELSDGKVVEEEQKLTFKFPTYINTEKMLDDDYTQYSEGTAAWLADKANYYYFYVGALSDTIVISNRIYFNVPPLPSESKPKIQEFDKYQKYHIEWEIEYNYAYVTDAIVEIQVNPAILVNNSFPVIVRNTTKDTIAIGNDVKIPLMMEAKDSLGVWKPIQSELQVMCGLGIGQVMLPPDEIVVTFAPKFEGSFRTLFRLTLGKNKTRPFWGKLNYEQFKIQDSKNI